MKITIKTFDFDGRSTKKVVEEEDLKTELCKIADDITHGNVVSFKAKVFIFWAMKCALCEKECPDIDTAIIEEWTPSFYVGKQEYQIVCPVCTEKYLRLDADCEFELRPEYVKDFSIVI